MNIDIIPLFVKRMEGFQRVVDGVEVLGLATFLPPEITDAFTMGELPGGPFRVYDGVPSPAATDNLLADFIHLDMDDKESFYAFVEQYGVDSFLPLVPDRARAKVKPVSVPWLGYPWPRLVYSPTDLVAVNRAVKKTVQAAQHQLSIESRNEGWLEELTGRESEQLPFAALQGCEGHITLYESVKDVGGFCGLVLTGLDIIGAAYLETIRLNLARKAPLLRSLVCHGPGCNSLIPATRPRSNYCSQRCSNNASRTREPRMIKDRLMKRARDKWGSGTPEYAEFYQALQGALEGAATDKKRTRAMEEVSLEHGLGSILEKNRPGRKPSAKAE